jgi:hypothetical protein
MSVQDRLRTCSYCNNNKDPQKPTVRIKSASSSRKERKLSELASIIKGVSYPSVSYVGVKKTNAPKTKGASNSNVRAAKLRELGMLVRGY